MQKSKNYDNTFFPAHVVKDAHDLFLSKLDQDKEIGHPYELTIRIGIETWTFDSIEEFIAEYPKSSYYRLDHMEQGNRIIVEGYGPGESRILRTTYILVSFKNRALIEAVFHVFERNAESSKIPDQKIDKDIPKEIPITVFIGHGRDPQWRDLKDHLQDKHGIKVIAYEVGPRAGLSIKEVLQDMLESSSLALLVLTGEDVHTDGELHARENVIHEVGLFQGRLGFERAIILLENGVKEFSNILGVNQIRFPTGGIRETFGDVIATLNRESGTKRH